MEIKAAQRHIRQAPRKVRLVANTIKEMPIEQAIRQLAVMQRAATLPVLKTLRQAVANATHNHGLNPADLRIKELIVNDGSTLKRWRAVSRGRAHSIFKKTCHVLVTLETVQPAAEAKQAAPAAPAAEKKAAPAKKAETTEKKAPAATAAVKAKTPKAAQKASTKKAAK